MSDGNMIDARTRMVRRAAREITAGTVVNLGIGLPTKVLDYLPADLPVCLHTENGMTGIGPTLPYDRADRNLIDAGGAYVSPVAGSTYFDSVASFALVRSGRLDLTMLGAIELGQKARRVVVMTTHTDRKGNPKLLSRCTLPLTARGCVARIFTDMAVVGVTGDGFPLVERAEGVTLPELQEATGAPLHMPAGDVPVF